MICLGLCQWVKAMISLSSYKDCPPFDLDKVLEDVQNGVYPITAYHLLFPTHNTLSLLTKSSISDRALTPSLSSNPSTTVSNSDYDGALINSAAGDSLIFHSVDSNSNHSSIYGQKGRSSTLVSPYERSTSGANDAEHHGNESTSTTVTNPTTTTTSTTANSHSNADEKESRRIIDIQCKVKTKDTGLQMVKRR